MSRALDVGLYLGSISVCLSTWFLLYDRAYGGVMWLSNVFILVAVACMLGGLFYHVGRRGEEEVED